MYKRAKLKWTKHADFIFIDTLCLLISYIVVYYIRHGTVVWQDQPRRQLYIETLVVLLFINVFNLMLTESFRNVLKRDKTKELASTLRHTFMLAIINLIWLAAIKQTNEYSNFMSINVFIMYAVLAYVTRLLWKQVLRKGKGLGKKRKLLLVTEMSNASETITGIKQHNYENYVLDEICILDASPEQIGGSNDGLNIIANKDTLLQYVTEHWVDEIFFGGIDPAEPYYPLISELAETGITLHIAIPSLQALAGTKQYIEKIGGDYVVTSALMTMTPAQLIAKRIMDIIGGLIGSLITILITPVIGLMIQAADPGPIFYASERVGENGKIFKMYKFRSMVRDAEKMKEEVVKESGKQEQMMFKMEHDPRVIGGRNGIGEFIRKTSLDEFPQFFNVLKGDMSMVGTRPPTIDEWAKYKPAHRARLSTKPGITGVWQISGRSQISNFEEVVRMDKEYITNWSILNDIKIILKTIVVVLSRQGAY